MNISGIESDLHDLMDELRWVERPLKNGFGLLKARKTLLSIYDKDTTIPDTVEVGFSLENIEYFYNISGAKTECFINELQEVLGESVPPKYSQKYPKVAFDNPKEFSVFIKTLKSFLHSGDYQSHLRKFDTSSKDYKRTAEQNVRVGQQDFRSSLLDVYSGKCAITGCSVIEVLDAAHIEPHSENPSYAISDGILLRADIHKLFDRHLLSINPDNWQVVLKQSCLPSYSELAGKEIALPSQSHFHPDLKKVMSHYYTWKS